MNITELLQHRGLDLSLKRRIKMLRHKSSRYDIPALHKQGQLAIYQSIQKEDVLGQCSYVISFLGLERTRSLFVGVWRVLNKKASSQAPREARFLYPEMYKNARWYYKMEKVPGFDDLIDRVVVDWGRNPRMWHQWLKEMPVIEILPTGYVMDFPGYLDFVLEFHNLKKIVNNPEANRIWHARLQAVAGIYLIVDTVTGRQYVGSAYGKGGVLGRWRNYARTGHGGNTLLKGLVESDPGYEENFHFTILRTLPTTLTRKEVIEYESRFKWKLGPRSFGLNLN